MPFGLIDNKKCTPLWQNLPPPLTWWTFLPSLIHLIHIRLWLTVRLRITIWLSLRIRWMWYQRVDVALTGRHLIEASAGTGKTWTLTGIVLRLLIEARRAPEQIIATTFTRAAAAEMRQRIHDRLVDFYQLLQWVNSLSADRANKESLYPHILQVTPDSDKQAVNSSNTDSNAEIDADELNRRLCL